MISHIVRRATPTLAALLLAAPLLSAARAQAPVAVLDDSIPPGNNFDKAQFRLWIPREAGTLRGALILVPGSNGDGRAQAQDTVWQAFATKQKLAIVGVRFTDKPHDQNFIEDYVNVSRGSGQALLDALAKFAGRVQHPELANAPLVFFGDVGRRTVQLRVRRVEARARHRVRRQQGWDLLHRPDLARDT